MAGVKVQSRSSVYLRIRERKWRFWEGFENVGEKAYCLDSRGTAASLKRQRRRIERVHAEKGLFSLFPARKGGEEAELNIAVAAG